MRQALIILFVSVATSFASAQTHLNAEVARIMQDRKGTAVMLDIKSNKIIAAYHPDVAARRLALPGSTVKTFTLLAMLQSGKLRSDEKFLCRRNVHVGQVNLTCSHPQTGQPFDAATALAYSCNDYFTTMATRLTGEELRTAFVGAGLTSPTKLLPNEATGSVQLTETVEQRQLEAIGEFGIKITPLALLAAYRSRALRLSISSMSLGEARVFSGLQGATEYGVARLAQPKGLQVAGKTGTARADEGPWTHGWFVGWAPAKEPKVAIVVFLERGTGPADAAPLAAQILQAWTAEPK